MSDFNELFKQASNESLTKLDRIVEMGIFISNESVNLAFIDTAKSKFYDYVGRVHNFIKSLNFTSDAVKPIDAREMLQRFGQQDYSANRRLNFEVAPGFTGNLEDFMSLMVNTLLPAAEESEKGLKIINTRLAVLLNEPDRLKAQSGIRDLDSHLTLVDPKVLEKIKTFFKAGAKSQVTVKDVMDRNADMPAVYEKTNALSNRLSKVDFKKLQAMVSRLGELAGSLNKQINEGDEGRSEVAGSIAAQLSDLFYRVGVTLTACSVLLELAKQHREAMERNVEGLLSQLPKSEEKAEPAA